MAGNLGICQKITLKRKKNKLASQQQCNRGTERKLIEERHFWLIHTPIKNKHGPAPRGQPMFSLLPPQEACIDQACTFSTQSADGKCIWTLASVYIM